MNKTFQWNCVVLGLIVTRSSFIEDFFLFITNTHVHQTSDYYQIIIENSSSMLKAYKQQFYTYEALRT